MFKMRVADLIASYRTDPASSFGRKDDKRLRFRTREHYDCLLRVIEADLGAQEVGSIRTKALILTHQAWMLRGVPMAHALVGMLRTLCSYGMVLLEDNDCMALSTKMGAMRFEMGKPRRSQVTAEQATLIRNKARQWGLYSIAQAQAFQFDCAFRQRDVVGEWIPETEPGQSDTFDGGFKWLRGIRWEEIDDNLILRHTTSKRQKDVELNLTLAPMVMAELHFDFLIVEPGKRHRLPASGPVIVSEATGLPYAAHEFRRLWRGLARSCGIPDHIKNMDSRSGAVTEGFMSGASADSIRKLATHSELSTTNRYSRGDAEAIADVMRARAAHRGVG
jgi:hypothetical protein